MHPNTDINNLTQFSILEGITSQVTQEDIDIGIAGHCSRCPIARSLNRTLTPNEISIDTTIVIIHTTNTSLTLYINLSQEVKNWINNFDNFEPVDPIDLVIRSQSITGHPHILEIDK